jgi:hypothetical protein
MGTLPVWDFGTRKAKQLMTGSGPGPAQTAAAAGAASGPGSTAVAANAAAVAAAAAMGGTLRSGDALKSAVVERYVTGSGMGTLGSGALSGGLSGTLSGGLSGGLSAAGSLRPGELGPAAAAGVAQAGVLEYPGGWVGGEGRMETLHVLCKSTDI